MKFKFTGSRPLYYSVIGLLAEPGSEHDFDKRPDPRWEPVETPKPKPAKDVGDAN